MKIDLRTTTAAGALALMLTTSIAAASGGKPHPPGRDYELPPEDRAWVEKVQEITNESRQRLREAHDKALAEPDVQEAVDTLRVAMEEEMLKLDPTAEPIIRERYEVFTEMIRYQRVEPVSMENADRVGELTAEYKRLTDKLGHLPRMAADTERVRNAQAAFQSALMARMIEIDPAVPELMEIQKEMRQEFIDYRDNMLGRHGPGASDEESPDGSKK